MDRSDYNAVNLNNKFVETLSSSFTYYVFVSELNMLV